MLDGLLYIASGNLALIAVFLFVYTTIRRVILTERKFKELLPNCKGVKRYPPLFEINPHSIPKTENGKLFLYYRKKYLHRSLVSIAIAVGILLVAYLINELH